MKPINNMRSMVSWWRSLEPNRDDLRRESRSNINNNIQTITFRFVQTTTITFRHFVPENQYPTMTRFKGVALEMFGTWNSSDFVDFTEFFNAEWLRMTSFKAKSSKCTHFLFPNQRSLNPLQGHLTIPTKTSLRYHNEKKNCTNTINDKEFNRNIVRSGKFVSGSTRRRPW